MKPTVEQLESRLVPAHHRHHPIHHPPVPTAPPLLDTLERVGDGSWSAVSWSAPGQPASVSVWIDAATLPADQVAVVDAAILAINADGTGFRFTFAHDAASAQVVVEGTTQPLGTIEAITSFGLAGVPPAVLPQDHRTLWRLGACKVDIVQGLPWDTSPAAPTASQLDLATVVFHELGHVAGLDHYNAIPDVMNATTLPGAIHRGYGVSDLALLHWLYG